MTEADDALSMEQHMLDLSEEVKEAVVVLSQGLADLADKLAGTDKLEAAITALGKSLPAGLKSDSLPIAQAILDGLKGLKITAPDVHVTVEATMPEQQPPTVNIESAKEWSFTHEYDEHGRIKSSRAKKIA